MKNIYVRLLFENVKKKKEMQNETRKTFYDYTYRQLESALKDFLGRDDELVVDMRFATSETILVRFCDQWVTIFLDQLDRYL